MNVEEAARHLRAGGLVLHPTGGLIGIAADPGSTKALAALNATKRLRPGPRPFVLLVPSLAEAPVAHERLARRMQESLEKLTASFWPGGLTLVLPASDDAPRAVCRAGDHGPTVAVRVDDHPGARALVAAFGGPLISTSANPTGQPPPVRFEDVGPAIRERCAALRAPPEPDGRPSTVVDLTGAAPVVLRAGRVSIAG